MSCLPGVDVEHMVSSERNNPEQSRPRGHPCDLCLVNVDESCQGLFGNGKDGCIIVYPEGIPWLEASG